MLDKYNMPPRFPGIMLETTEKSVLKQAHIRYADSNLDEVTNAEMEARLRLLLNEQRSELHTIIGGLL